MSGLARGDWTKPPFRETITEFGLQMLEGWFKNLHLVVLEQNAFGTHLLFVDHCPSCSNSLSRDSYSNPTSVFSLDLFYSGTSVAAMILQLAEVCDGRERSLDASSGKLFGYATQSYLWQGKPATQ